MQRTIVNLIVDLTAAVLLLAMIATGYLLQFPLPPGTNKALSLWGLTRHQWGEIHFWISLGLLTMLAVHLVLHWRWLVNVIRQRMHLEKSGTSQAGWITGVIVIGLFGVFAWAAHVGVQERFDPCCDDKGKMQANRPEENPSLKRQSRKRSWQPPYSGKTFTRHWSDRVFRATAPTRQRATSEWTAKKHS
jgi:hypothetical protein